MFRSITASKLLLNTSIFIEERITLMRDWYYLFCVLITGIIHPQLTLFCLFFMCLPNMQNKTLWDSAPG